MTTLEGRLHRLMLLPLVVGALVAAALVGELSLLSRSARLVDRSDRVIAQARKLDNALAEDGDGIDRALAPLGVLVADDAEAQARWRRLDEAIHAPGRALAASRRDLDAFIAAETALRHERAQRERRLSRALVVGTLAAALLLAGALGLFARRQLRAVAADYEVALARARAQTAPSPEDDKLRRLIEAVEDYAIILFDPHGNVSSWNAGAERGTGWRADEIVGRSFAVFFTPADRAAGMPARQLAEAADKGTVRTEALRVRKDGAELVAEVTLTAVRDRAGQLAGFASIARDVGARKRSEAAIAKLNAELEQRVVELAAANGELEAFSYSVSHDLRGPLRAIDGFSKILQQQYRDKLDEQGQHFLSRVRAGSQRMGQLIDDLLSLARINRAEMVDGDVDLAELARDVVEELRHKDAARTVEVVIPARLPARGDPRLLRAALDNLVGNAWKFTGKTAAPRIELGSERRDGVEVYFVKDNGAGFDMAYVHKLFAPFQRLHTQSEFEGTGIGLATVKRIITRHGGKLWAESTVGQGATFWFTLGSA